jgi:glycosyltransferase involved in cell wall biosynthesis
VCFRNGRACDDCLGRRLPWPGVLHGCYRGSRAASAGVGAMLALHRLRGTWHDKVDLYIAPTAFVRDKLVQGGLPAEKIIVKSHFVDPDPGPGAGRGGYALYVGRLSPEKGVDVLLSAWRGTVPGLPLRIVGAAAEGCGAVSLERGRRGSVEWLGPQPHERIQALMRRAFVLVFPSLCYETFGLVIAEAYAAGLPVIGADLGTAAAMVEDGVTGLRFRAGDPDDLAAKVAWLWQHPGDRAALARAARREFERAYTAVRGYRGLLEAYRRAKETAACAA